MDERHGLTDLRILQRTDPARLGRRVGVEPAADGADDEDVAQPGDHGLAAGAGCGRLGRDHPEDARQPLEGSAVARRVDVDDLGQHLEQVPGRRVGETNRSADQVDPLAAAAVAQDGVVGAQVVVRQIHHRCGTQLGVVGRGVSGAVREHRQVTPPKHPLRAVAVDQHAGSRRDHVEPEAVGHRRQAQRPRSGQLGSAVEDALHPQELQRLGERIRRRRDGRLGEWLHIQSSVGVRAAVAAKATASTPSVERTMWRRFHGSS